MSWVVRPAAVRDARAIARVHVAAWQVAYDGIVPADRLRGMDPARIAGRWAESLADPGGVSHLVVERDGTVHGFAVGGPYRPQQDADPGEETTGWGELYAIYVAPGDQGHGAGSALHDVATDDLAAAGHRVAALWVLEQNHPAREWYSRRGWSPDGSVSLWDAGSVQLREVRLLRDLRDPHDLRDLGNQG